jgi:hypothetical protein
MCDRCRRWRQNSPAKRKRKAPAFARRHAPLLVNVGETSLRLSWKIPLFFSGRDFCGLACRSMTGCATLQNAQLRRLSEIWHTVRPQPSLPTNKVRAGTFLVIVRIRRAMLRDLKLEIRLRCGILFFRENPASEHQGASTIWLRLCRAATGRTK